MEELEKPYARKTDSGWMDDDGFVSPIRPGEGPRANPQGDFPTGPEVGSLIPELQCKDAEGMAFTLSDIKGKPTVLMFNRSVVW